MDVKSLHHVHLIGIGGINMSAVAKLLLHHGVHVTGSDEVDSEMVERLRVAGAAVTVGHHATNIPPETELVIYTSAAQVTNPERVAAVERGMPQMSNFAFLAEWFVRAKTIAITGTHGKSTTTAMVGLALEKAGMDPTVIVGSKVPAFAEGNIRFGREDLFVIEGDEYARHFLEFHPDGLILNNLELDHTDVFHNLDALLQSFHELIGQVKDHGVIVANVGDERIANVLVTEKESLDARGIRVIPFRSQLAESGKQLAESSKQLGSVWTVSSEPQNDALSVSLSYGSETVAFMLSVPGHFNALNAAGAYLLARELGAKDEDIRTAFQSFTGIWRRFEHVAEQNGIDLFSDYAHHPTAVQATLDAARTSYPNAKILLCFQPHHRNRTKSLFLDFIPSFDSADAIVFAEIYDVVGREAKEDHDISSQDLLDAVVRHDADRGISRPVEFVADPTGAILKTLTLAKPGNVVMVMGAGDIDAALRKMLKVK